MYVGQIRASFCLPFEFVTYHVGGWLTRILDYSTIISYVNVRSYNIVYELTENVKTCARSVSVTDRRRGERKEDSLSRRSQARYENEEQSWNVRDGSSPRLTCHRWLKKKQSLAIVQPHVKHCLKDRYILVFIANLYDDRGINHSTINNIKKRCIILDRNLCNDKAN